MALREIRKDGDPVLRKICRPVTEYNERLWTLLDDMAETMYAANGVGLAAPQVGILKRVVVIDVGDGLIEMINPELIKSSGAQVGQEGCLSIPGVWGDVQRPAKVKVQAMDRHGNLCTYRASELLAVAMCHEMDHLDGILFKDKATQLEQTQVDADEVEV